MPYPIALVLTGLVLGVIVYAPVSWSHDLGLTTIELTPHLVLVVFLPALLFEATLHIEVPALSYR